MKKFVEIMLTFVMIIAVITATAEPASNRDEAVEILENYARKENMYWWLEGHYDAETETSFALLTADKNRLLELYGFDFDSNVLTEFANFYEAEFNKLFPEGNIKVKAAPVDCVNETMIYELIVTSDVDMEPDDTEQIVKCGRALFVMY